MIGTKTSLGVSYLLLYTVTGTRLIWAGTLKAGGLLGQRGVGRLPGILGEGACLSSWLGNHQLATEIVQEGRISLLQAVVMDAEGLDVVC